MKVKLILYYVLFAINRARMSRKSFAPFWACNFIEEILQQFDFILSGVLHHLIGKTRRKSKNYSLSVTLNCLKLLKENEHLITIEPTFYPSIATDIIFCIKNLSTKITSR